MLTRFQGWTSSTLGTTSPMPRMKGLGMGIKKRAKNFLARPGIQKAMGRIGRATGTGAGWAKGAVGSVREKAGFSTRQALAQFRRRRRKSGRRRKPTAGGHIGKGAAYGALSGGALGASVGGAGSYAAARKMGMGRLGAAGIGAVGGVMGGIQGGLSGAMTGGTVGAATYGVKKIREDRRRR